MMCMNYQGLTNWYGSVVFHILSQLALFLCPSNAQAGSLKGVVLSIYFVVDNIYFVFSLYLP